MNNLDISKKTILIIVLLLCIVVFGFVSCTNNKKDKKSTQFQSSILQPSTTRAIKRTPNTTSKIKTSTTLAPYNVSPFNEAAKRELYALATTGETITNNPGQYISPRYEAILGGDTSSGIPLSELDNPVNSDLPASTFTAVRDNAIAITKAQITGEGANNYPSYFGEMNEPGTCKSFQLKHAGATTLPILNDNRWVVATIFWSATCGDKTPYKVDQQTSVYFTLVNNALTPRQYYDIPGA